MSYPVLNKSHLALGSFVLSATLIGSSQQSSVPVVTLGNPELVVSEGTSGYQFVKLGTVAGSAIAMANGDLAVTQPSTNQIAIFDASGKLKTTVGRSGDGPGEFRAINGMGLLGDTLWVFDANSNRFNLFRSNYSYVTTITPVRTWGQPRPANVLGLMNEGRVFGLVVRPATEGARAAVAMRDGTAMKELAILAQRSFVPNGRVGNRNISLSASEFQNDPLLARSPESDRLFVLERRIPVSSAQSSYVVAAINIRGDTLWRRSVPFVPQPVSTTLVESIRTYLSTPDVPRESADSIIRGLPRFASPVSGMVATSGGGLWIAERSTQSGRATWLLLDRNGNPQLKAAIDTAHKLVAARGNQLWTMSLDANDLPTLNRFVVTGAR